MHIKMCIIDGEKVISGSYNWTKNANSNKEECIISNGSDDVKKCLEEFWAIWEQSILIDFEQIEKNAKFDLAQLESFENRGLSPEQMDASPEVTLITINQSEPDMDIVILNNEFFELTTAEEELKEGVWQENIDVYAIEAGTANYWVRIKAKINDNIESFAIYTDDLVEMLKNTDSRLQDYFQIHRKFPFRLFTNKLRIWAPVKLKFNEKDNRGILDYPKTAARIIPARDAYDCIKQKCGVTLLPSLLENLDLKTEPCFG